MLHHVKQIPNGTTEPLGIQVLKSRGFFPHEYWYWIGLGAMFGFIILFNFGFSVALAYLNRECFVSVNLLNYTTKERFFYEKMTIYKHYSLLFVAFGTSRSVKSEDSEETTTLTELSSRRSSRSSSTRPRTAVESNSKRGMVLPFQPHSITFDEITYSVDMPAVNTSTKVVPFIVQSIKLKLYVHY